MSEIYIHYGNLEDSVKRSQKVRGEISGYVEEIKKRITTPISGLSGSDSAGYASTASSLAWQKITSLNNKANRFSAYEGTVNTLISTAKTKDNYVSGQIETIAGMYVEKRKWYQKAGDWIYNTFCVDLANKWDWTRDLSDAAKWVSNKVGNAFEPIVDWFKYGDGKYVWNIVSAVVGTVVAIGGAIAAICAIPFSGGATIPIVIGCIGAAAASVGAIITTVNSVTSIVQNSKAISKSGDLFDENDGDPSAARHYGSQTKLSTYIEKNDMGDKKDNENWATVGKTVDTVKVVADVTSFVCSIANLGVVHDYRIKNGSDINTRVNHGKWNEGFDFSYKNIKKNIMHDMGYKVSSGKLDNKKAFGIDKSIFAKSYDTDKFTLKWNAWNFKIGKKTLFSVDKGTWSLGENAVKFFRGAKVFKNVNDIGENVVTLNDYFTYRDTAPSMESASGAVEATTDLLGHMKFYSPFGDYGTDAGKTISDILELFAG